MLLTTRKGAGEERERRVEPPAPALAWPVLCLEPFLYLFGYQNQKPHLRSTGRIKADGSGVSAQMNMYRACFTHYTTMPAAAEWDSMSDHSGATSHDLVDEAKAGEIQSGVLQQAGTEGPHTC